MGLFSLFFFFDQIQISLGFTRRRKLDVELSREVAVSSAFLTYLAAMRGQMVTVSRMKMAETPSSVSAEAKLASHASSRRSATHAWN